MGFYESMYHKGNLRINFQNNIIYFKRLISFFRYCFMYAILIALHHEEVPVCDRNKRRSYPPFMHLYDFSMLSVPTKLKEIKQFEVVNQISVNLFHFEKTIIYPLQTLKTSYDKTVDLLVVNEEKDGPILHVIPITDLSLLLPPYSDHKKFICRCCKYILF